MAHRDDEIQEALHSHFQLESLHSSQQQAIDAVLLGNDTLVFIPTGGGKSLCFQLSAMLLDGVSIIVSPLIALMKDQVQRLREKGLPVQMWSSENTAAQRRDLEADLMSCKQGRAPLTKMVYVAPEAFTDRFHGILKTLYGQKRLALFAVDEAHCISTHGQTFRPKYRQLGTLRERYDHVPIIALTATATPRIEKDIIDLLHLRRRSMRTVRASYNRPEISYSVLYAASQEEKYAVLLRFLAAQTTKPANSKLSDEPCVVPCGIIYCLMRRECEEVAARLQIAGLSCEAYHAALPLPDRTARQERWMNGTTSILVATVAFGMGIDKRDVRFVVHFTMPKTMDGMYQESGRAGRDRKASQSLVIYSPEDRRLIEWILGQELSKAKAKKGGNSGTSTGSGEDSGVARVKAQSRLLHEMIDYCLKVGCRREYILKCFGETLAMYGTTCNKTCDYCRNGDRVRRGIQAITSSVLRTGGGSGSSINRVTGEKVGPTVNRGKRRSDVDDLKLAERKRLALPAADRAAMDVRAEWKGCGDVILDIMAHAEEQFEKNNPAQASDKYAFKGRGTSSSSASSSGSTVAAGNDDDDTSGLMTESIACRGLTVQGRLNAITRMVTMFQSKYEESASTELESRARNLEYELAKASNDVRFYRSQLTSTLLGIKRGTILVESSNSS